MTVQQEQSYISHVYSGPGDYPFHFTIHNVNQLRVTHLSDAGTPHELALNSDYTLTFDSENSTGVVHSSYDVASGSLDIRRSLVIEQLVDYVNNSAFDMEILERSLDYLTLITQDAMREVLIGAVTTNWRGDWVSGTDYNPKDVVVAPNSNWYTATVLHTAGDFDTDLAGGKWKLAADISVIEGYKNQANTSASSAAVSEANAATSEFNAAASAVLAQQAIDGGHSLAAGNGIDIVISGSNPIIETISVANIISSDLTLYLNPAGDDTTGDGTQVNPWKSINRAMDFLKDKILVSAVFINIANGSYVFNETQIIDHPYASKIDIAGNDVDNTVIQLWGAGITEPAIHIKNCSGIQLGRFTSRCTSNSNGVGIHIENSNVILTQDIKTAHAFIGIMSTKSNISANYLIHLSAEDDIQYGLEVFSSIVNLGYFKCADTSGYLGVGIRAVQSSVKVRNGTEVSDCHGYAFQAEDSSQIMLKGTLNLSNNTHDSVPQRTTGINTAPNFGNYGSFIMSA